MTFKTAQEFFEEAKTFAEERQDEFGEAIAAGMIDLTRAIKSELNRMKSEMDSIKNRVK